MQYVNNDGLVPTARDGGIINIIIIIIIIVIMTLFIY